MRGQVAILPRPRHVVLAILMAVWVTRCCIDAVAFVMEEIWDGALLAVRTIELMVNELMDQL